MPRRSNLADHPKTVNLREDVLVESINGWLGRVFDRANVDETVFALVESQAGVGALSSEREAIKHRLSDAESRIQRYQTAIAAGVDPSALVDAINQAQAERAAAQAQTDNVPAETARTEAELYAMIDSLGDVKAVLTERRPAGLERLYRGLGLELRYETKEQAVYATACPRVDSKCVRGGTRTPVRCIHAQDAYSCGGP